MFKAEAFFARDGRLIKFVIVVVRSTGPSGGWQRRA